MKFTIDNFVIERVAKAGAWLVTSDSTVDLGMLFLRPQEFYESSNPAFKGRAFTVTDFMRWYINSTAADNTPCSHHFSYFEDFTGYNIPGDAVLEYLQLPLPELSVWDTRFARIATVIQQHQRGRFYIIGALNAKMSVIAHELAHAMYYLLPDYRTQMDAHMAALPADAQDVISSALTKSGYSSTVLLDETQAYMATGLLDAMENMEALRMPFMKTFARWRKRFIPSKRKPKCISPA